MENLKRKIETKIDELNRKISKLKNVNKNLDIEELGEIKNITISKLEELNVMRQKLKALNKNVHLYIELKTYKNLRYKNYIKLDLLENDLSNIERKINHTVNKLKEKGIL